MKIGIIGPLDSSKKVADIMQKDFPELTPQIYEASKAEEAYLELEMKDNTIFLTTTFLRNIIVYKYTIAF